MRSSIVVLFVFLLLNVTAGFAQKTDLNSNKIYSDGVAYAQAGDFKRAVPIFKRVLKANPTSPEVNYYLGYCYLNTTEGPDSAQYFFQKGLEYLPENDFDSQLGVDMRYSLAKSYQLTLKTTKAIAEYEKLMSVLPADAIDLRTQIIRDIETCHFLAEAIKNPVGMRTKNIGPIVNSKNDDHSPLISADGSMLFFTTRRPSSYSATMPDGQHSEKIYFSKRNEKTGEWAKPIIINKLFRSEGHESCVSLSADGNELYLFRNDIKGKNLYVCNFDGSTWSEPVKLAKPVNSDFNETHITLSPDKSLAYFTSDRPGGLGGLDIYQVRRLPNGQWSLPKNLGPGINTPYDEETPMLHPDGKTIYFSSEGHNSIGGLDIFTSKIQEDSTWSKPFNMGYPINTPDDDFFFVPTATYNQAWYASAKYKDTFGGHDIYQLEYDATEESKVAVFSGEVNGSENVPIENIRVNVIEKETNELVGLYKPHPGTGKYLLILEYGKEYMIEYAGEGFLPSQKELAVTYDMTFANVQKSIALEPMQLVAIERPKAEIIAKTATSLPVDQKSPSKGSAWSEKTDAGDGIPYYTVQILTLKKPVASWDKAFKGLDQSMIKEYKCKNNIYRYAYGQYKGFKAAVRAKQKIVEATPYQDSFIRDIKQYDELIETE
jgi:hypothetical protein